MGLERFEEPIFALNSNFGSVEYVWVVIVDEAFEAINKLVSDETYETVPTSTFVALKILSPGLNCLNEVPVPVTLVEPLETEIVPGPYILLDDKDFAAKIVLHQILFYRNNTKQLVSTQIYTQNE